MNSTDLLLDYVKKNHTIKNMRRLSTELPISYRQILRVVDHLRQTGRVTAHRSMSEHGQPMVISEVDECLTQQY